MKLCELWACSLSSWYPAFEDLTIPTTTIPLPKEVLEYLRSSEEGLRLPGDLPASPFAQALRRWEERVDGVLRSLGGEAFPKLNWSSPRDARWIAAGQSLRCTSADDVLLLLKASEFAAHDLGRAEESCEDYAASASGADGREFQLNLRQWAQSRIRPATELRLFLRRGFVVGGSQRECSERLESLVEEREAVLEEAADFAAAQIAPRLPPPLRDAVVADVFFEVVSGAREWRLLDLNVWGEPTDSLLWDWDQLNALSPNVKPELRLTESAGVRGSSYAAYGVPADAAAADPEALAKLIAAAQARPNDLSSDEEDPA